MKYEIGMRFIIDNTIYVAESFSNGKYVLEPENILDYKVDGEHYIEKYENELPLPMYDDYYDYDSATIGRTDHPKQLMIAVNPDSGRIGNPYFKVYDTIKLKPNETKVARLHFFDSDMEYHKDKYKDWVITKSDIKAIIDFLKQKNKDFQSYTNWQMLCWSWNNEYGFDDTIMNINDYMNGKYDNMYLTHQSYVPSTTKIPDTWIYKPPKGKNKRS